jgi:hypothetical protein
MRKCKSLKSLRPSTAVWDRRKARFAGLAPKQAARVPADDLSVIFGRKAEL